MHDPNTPVPPTGASPADNAALLAHAMAHEVRRLIRGQASSGDLLLWALAEIGQAHPGLTASGGAVRIASALMASSAAWSARARSAAADTAPPADAPIDPALVALIDQELRAIATGSKTDGNTLMWAIATLVADQTGLAPTAAATRLAVALLRASTRWSNDPRPDAEP